MAQPLCKRTKLALSSDLETLSGMSEDMDVPTENRSVEVQGAGARELEGNRQSNSYDVGDCLIDSDEFEQILLRSGAFIDKTLFIKSFFRELLNEKFTAAKNILITAPNRFGKSVIMNTLKVFCEPEVDEEGNIVTCLKKNAAGKWVEDKDKTPPKNYQLFKTVIRNKPLQIYSCTCPTQHMSDDLENGTCESRQFFYQHCGQHPLIFLSLKSISPKNWNQFIEGFKESLCETYQQHMYLGDDKQSHLSEYMKAEFNLFCKGKKCKMNQEGQPITLELDEHDLVYSLNRLVEYLHIQFNKRVLILIDDFDAPLMQLLHNGKFTELSYIKKIVQFIDLMTGRVLEGNEQILGTLVNGCTLLATTPLWVVHKVSICRFLENHEFSEYYGFTKAEVADLLKMHSFKGFNEADILSYYNCYQVLGTNLQLYNTFSLLKCLQDWKDAWQREKRGTNKTPDKKKQLPRYYFSKHGINQLNNLFEIFHVRDKLNKIITNGSSNVGRPVSKMTPHCVFKLKEEMLDCNEISYDDDNVLIQYMKDRGYFNIIEQIGNEHVYALPNGEAKDEIMTEFHNISYYKRKYNISDVMIDECTRAINDLDRNNNESFQKFADSIAILFSGDFKRTSDQCEIRNVLYTICKEEFDVSSERLCQENSYYRCDLLLIRKDGTGIIMEVKWDHNTALAGLKQIFDNEYYKVLETENITKDKLYIGLHMNHPEVTVCAFATSNEAVVKNFANIPEEKLVVKSSKPL